MDKFSRGIIAVLLLVVWSSLVCAGNWGTQHRSVGADASDPGEIVFFILYVLISEFGKKLDKNYICPVYCEVKHRHIYETEESNIQTASRIHRPDASKSGEQSEDGLRACSDVHGLCGDVRQIEETE